MNQSIWTIHPNVIRQKLDSENRLWYSFFCDVVKRYYERERLDLTRAGKAAESKHKYLLSLFKNKTDLDPRFVPMELMLYDQRMLGENHDPVVVQARREWEAYKKALYIYCKEERRSEEEMSPGFFQDFVGHLAIWQLFSNSLWMSHSSLLSSHLPALETLDPNTEVSYITPEMAQKTRSITRKLAVLKEEESNDLSTVELYVDRVSREAFLRVCESINDVTLTREVPTLDRALKDLTALLDQMRVDNGIRMLPNAYETLYQERVNTEKADFIQAHVEDNKIPFGAFSSFVDEWAHEIDSAIDSTRIQLSEKVAIANISSQYAQVNHAGLRLHWFRKVEPVVRSCLLLFDKFSKELPLFGCSETDKESTTAHLQIMRNKWQARCDALLASKIHDDDIREQVWPRVREWRNHRYELAMDLDILSFKRVMGDLLRTVCERVAESSAEERKNWRQAIGSAVDSLQVSPARIYYLKAIAEDEKERNEMCAVDGKTYLTSMIQHMTELATDVAFLETQLTRLRVHNQPILPVIEPIPILKTTVDSGLVHDTLVMHIRDAIDTGHGLLRFADDLYAGTYRTTLESVRLSDELSSIIRSRIEDSLTTISNSIQSDKIRRFPHLYWDLATDILTLIAHIFYYEHVRQQFMREHTSSSSSHASMDS